MKEIIIFPFRNEDPFKNGCVPPYCIFHNALFEIIHFAFGSMALASLKSLLLLVMDPLSWMDVEQQPVRKARDLKPIYWTF